MIELENLIDLCSKTISIISLLYCVNLIFGALAVWVGGCGGGNGVRAEGGIADCGVVY